MRRRQKLPIGAVHKGHRIRRRRPPWWRLPVLIVLAIIIVVVTIWKLTHPGTPVSDAASAGDVSPGGPEREPEVTFNAPALIPIDDPVDETPPPRPTGGPEFAPEEQNFRERWPRDVFEAQIALTRDGICPGSIDGGWGGQTRNAVIAFQQKHGLRVTAQLDNETRKELLMSESPLTTYTITADDFLRLRPLPEGWLARSTLDRLDFSTILELVAEKHWTNPKQIKRLNPDVNWETVIKGTRVVVPRVGRTRPETQPTLIVIHLADKTLQVFDANSRLLAHFPCSIARRVEKRPVGELEVVEAAKDPNYTFDPGNFPDSTEAQRIGKKLILNPGPNNPVGTAWIGLNLPGYGIHGTPDPERVGRTESSGCFRLKNWNANYLLDLVYLGMRVQVEQ